MAKPKQTSVDLNIGGILSFSVSLLSLGIIGLIILPLAFGKFISLFYNIWFYVVAAIIFLALLIMKKASSLSLNKAFGVALVTGIVFWIATLVVVLSPLFSGICAYPIIGLFCQFSAGVITIVSVFTDMIGILLGTLSIALVSTIILSLSD